VIDKKGHLHGTYTNHHLPSYSDGGLHYCQYCYCSNIMGSVE
jgi:hypothetical protein